MPHQARGSTRRWHGVLVWVLPLVLSCVDKSVVRLDDDGGKSSSGSDSVTSTAATATTTTTSTTTSTTATTTTTTTLPDPTTSSTTTPDPADDTTPDPDSAGSQFIPEPDGEFSFDCDLYAQDCPQGDKCMPWAYDGGSVWNATRCSPIADDPGQAGEPCLMEGFPFSGLDDCEQGAMCWDVDPVTLEGTCVNLCIGSDRNPHCADPGESCILSDDGFVAVCLP